MTRELRSTAIITLLLAAAILNLAPDTSAEIHRVARKINYLQIKGGFTLPIGTVSGYQGDSWSDIFGLDETSPDIGADSVYKNTWSAGFDYGFLRWDHAAFSFGFEYTHTPVRDSVVIEFDTLIGIVNFNTVDVKVNLYDININADYYPFSPFTSRFLPYVGAGLSGGLLVFSGKGKDPETGVEFGSTGEVVLAAHANVGIDVKIWGDRRTGSFITVSRVNSYEFWASDYRPAHAHFNLGFKYFLKP